MRVISLNRIQSAILAGTLAGLALLGSGVSVLAQQSGDPDLLPSVPKNLLAQAGSRVSKPVGTADQAQFSRGDVERAALGSIPDVRLKEVALVRMDNDAVNRPIHRDVWVVSLDPKNGLNPVPQPDGSRPTKVRYLIMVYDAKSGEFLFGESQ
jgi:hypothetical protein